MLINRVQQRRRDEDEDAALESEVNSSRHNRHSIPSLSYPSPATNTTLFPPSLAPTPIGSQQDSAQQITRLLLNMNKSAVKYPTLSDLASALDEWAALAVRAKWSSEQVLAIVRYRTFVIDEIGRKSSVTQAAKYHALWSKAVEDGHIDMFAHGSQYHPLSYVTVFPSTSVDNSASSSSATKSSKKNNKGKETDKEKDKPVKRVFPAGSCTHHPLSTSHDTSMCNKK